MIIDNCKKIVGGSAEGLTLQTSQPINFLSMIDAKSGRITDPKHELHLKSLKGMVLIFPFAVGSSVGAYSIYSLRVSGTGPNAIVCTRADITTASGCAISNIPVVRLPEGVPPIRQGILAKVEADIGRITLQI
jgi:predicted aconitase with swiveling domain